MSDVTLIKQKREKIVTLTEIVEEPVGVSINLTFKEFIILKSLAAHTYYPNVSSIWEKFSEIPVGHLSLYLGDDYIKFKSNDEEINNYVEKETKKLMK